MRAAWSLATLVGLVAGCRTGSPQTALGAATMTAAGLGASAVSRASGGCYAICTAGTSCNSNTGFCERAPCGGSCSPAEHCEETFSSSRCAPGAAAIAVQAKTTGRTAAPIAPVLRAPDPDHAAPTVVPAAEQQPH